MTANNKAPTTNKTPVTRDRNIRLVDTKAIAVATWSPQPNPLTREEIRRLVVDQIG